MSEHDELGELLHRIAATVGDPPEHGLERVDARRRRRTRHRRGAVAAAVALAVSGVTAIPWLTGMGEGADLAADSGDGTEQDTSGLPDAVRVNCTPAGIDIPVAYIQPRRDGLLLLVHNGFPGEIDLWVRNDAAGWNSGRIDISTGNSEEHQLVPPGVLTVGCDIGGSPEERRVDLVDVDHIYKEPRLVCPPSERKRLEPSQFDETNSLKVAGSLSLGGMWRDEYDIGPAKGYPGDTYGYQTTAQVSVLVDGETLGLVTIVDDDEHDGRKAASPWVGASVGEICQEIIDGQPSTPESPPTSVNPPPP